MPPPSPAGHGPGPSSQVTADVVKFRCLFTHDLRRKSKRWQDGYLRFHTFNRRIMVFDEQGNFIGDHHWRSGEQVQDGDEMELDKGALIQVGECMGTVQTDLSSLLEKRKPSQGSPQSETQPRPSPLSSRSQATQSRSLNDMLGIKRTPIAHLVSPYEERHQPTPVENVRPLQPPPKRQKTSALDSNAQRAVVDLTQPKKDSKSMRSVPSVTSTREKPRPVADSQSARSSLSKDTPRIAPLTKPGSNVDNICPPASKPTASRPAPTFPSRDSPKDAPPSSAQLPERPQLSRNSLLEKSHSFAGTSSDTPMNTLRMAVEKPRRKLMYQALLPGEKSQKSSSEPSMPPPKKPSSRPASTSVETQTAVSLNVDSNEFAPSASTQFILEEMISGPRPEQPYQPPPTKTTLSPVPQQQPSAARRAATSRPANATKASSFSGVPEFPMNPPAISIPPVPSQTLSPNDNQNVRPSTAHPSKNPQNTVPILPAQRRLNAPLRKSLSDPTALIGQTSLQPRPALTKSSLSTLAEQEEPQDQGPWSAEALDLFDFWPPGRPKPGESRL